MSENLDRSDLGTAALEEKGIYKKRFGQGLLSCDGPSHCRILLICFSCSIIITNSDSNELEQIQSPAHSYF